MILEILYCIIGTLAFAITMKAPKKSLIFITIGAAISASVERILSGFYGDFISCLLSMVCLSFFCELMARILKVPTTVLLMPSTIPLLPGSSIYYAMFYAIQSDTRQFVIYSKATLFAGLGIALGAVISSTIIKMINVYKIN